MTAHQVQRNQISSINVYVVLERGQAWACPLFYLKVYSKFTWAYITSMYSLNLYKLLEHITDLTKEDMC